MPAQARHTYEVLPPRLVQGASMPWPHEVNIALPPGYRQGDVSYPVVWVTDGSLLFWQVLALAEGLGTSGELPELLIVAVGAPRDVDAVEFSRRRAFDFYPERDWAPAGAGRPLLEANVPEGMRLSGGGAARFQSFLIDELRPELSREFRFSVDDHGLLGHSAGGHFVGYTLLSRTDSFHNYLAGSPALGGCSDLLFRLEAAYAAAKKDLQARVFFAAGEQELCDAYLAAADVVGSMTRMSQCLTVRAYPSLQLTCRIYPGQTHTSVASYVLSEGLRNLYAAR